MSLPSVCKFVTAHTKLWLMENFCIKNGSETSSNLLCSKIQMIKKNTDATCTSNCSSIGKFIKDIWGNQVRVVRRTESRLSGKVQNRVYINLTEINKSDHVHVPMTWESVKSYVPNGWICGCVDPPDDSVCWIYINKKYNETVNGCRVITEVKLTNINGMISVHVKHGPYSVKLDEIGLKLPLSFRSGQPTMHQINVMMDWLSQPGTICRGFELVVSNSSPVPSLGKADIWQKEGEEATLFIRKEKCLLIANNTPGLCENCINTKRYYFKRKSFTQERKRQTKLKSNGKI